MEAPECHGCRERDKRIAQLEARVLELEGNLRDLTDQIKKSTQPPKPPAAAPKLPASPAKKPTGRKPGGQEGHKAHLKRRLPLDQITQVIHYVPEKCGHCSSALPAEAGPNDPEPTWHQVAELPVMAAQITEYQGHYRTCPCCSKVTHAVIPPEIQAHSFASLFTATLSYMAGSLGLSKRNIEEFSEVIFGVPIALGSIANLEQEMSDALAPAHQEAMKLLEEAPVKHADETGWKQNGKKRWLWVGATASIVVFMISPWRNALALKRLLGEKLRGILCSDRWTVYDEWEPRRRQLCWAHLKRNWEKKAERGGKAQELAEAWLKVQKQVFELWHLFRGGTLNRHQLGDQIAPWMMEIIAILEQGSQSRDRKLARFCERIQKVQMSLWTFVVEEGVDPTNNHAERVLRRAVLWRRRSFGCHSQAGCRFVERILTVVQTLRLQGRSTLEFLKETIQAHRSGRKPPQLINGG